MGSDFDLYLEGLNDEDVRVRLDSLKKLAEMIERGELQRPVVGSDVNNHIHTTYSFSPYSPTKALWMAYNTGLSTAGIIDHDSVSGVEEFIEAGKIIGMATTIGVECRVDFSKTELKGRKMNNPDQNSIAYVTLHGIPHTKIGEVKEFLTPYLTERNKRNRLMVDKINDIMMPFGINLSFDLDVVPVSRSSEGGSITERHILFALSHKLIERFGKGKPLADFLKLDMKLNISSKVEGYLLDKDNTFYAYDLLGALKSDMVERFYIDASAECPDVKDYIALAKRTGAISAYAYLGDVGDSMTGDKKTQKFEDDYIELLFQVLRDLGFNGVTYMPSRNTLEQLELVKDLCRKQGFFEISGEDINSPRQSFICPALRNELFKNLIDATWALIGHEKAATENIVNGMFSEETILKFPDINERIEVFSKIGKVNK